MAKSAKNKTDERDEDERDEDEGSKGRPAPDSPEELARVRKRNTAIASVFVAITSASIGFVAWHRPRDPGRVWFKSVETRHEQRITAKLTTCFGGASAAQIRTNVAGIRRGTLPDSIKNCRGASLTELMALPLAVAADLGVPPGYAENGKRRAWDAYGRLQVSLRAYERALNAVPEGAAVPESARDALASAIDDVASDAESAKNAIIDLRNVVEDNASWY
jgi:hypothetical protein